MSIFAKTLMICFACANLVVACRHSQENVSKSTESSTTSSQPAAATEKLFTLKGHLENLTVDARYPNAKFRVVETRSKVDFETKGLSKEAEKFLADQNEVLIVGSYDKQLPGIEAIRYGAPPLIAQTLKKYVKRATAPTESQCDTLQEEFQKRYMSGGDVPSANMLWTQMGEDGECEILMGFENETELNKYKADRKQKQKSPDVEVLNVSSQKVEIVISFKVAGAVVSAQGQSSGT